MRPSLLLMLAPLLSVCHCELSPWPQPVPAPQSRWGEILNTLQLYACDASNSNQTFTYNAVARTIRSRAAPAQCVTVTMGNDGWSPAALTPCDGGVEQDLTLLPNGQIQMDIGGNCTYAPACKRPDCCVCFATDSITQRSMIQANSCQRPTAAPIQQFSYDNATGLIKSASSGLCLDSGTLPPLGILASCFSDHMVLQRGGAGAVVWGFLPSDTPVSISFAGSKYSAVAGEDGVWRLRLPAMGEGGPYTLTVASGSVSVTITDILMGDVYL